MAHLTGRAKLLRYLSSSIRLAAVGGMALTPVDIAQRVGETAGNLLRAAPGVAANAAALYIKEGTPPSLIPNVGVAVARQACRRYADNPDGVPGPVGAALEEVCRPYLDDIGYGAPPALEKPFEGGQCQGALYRVDYEFNDGSGNFTPAVFFLRGPLSLSRSLEPGDSSVSCPPGTSFTRATMIGFQGERRTLHSGCGTGSRNISVSPFEGAANNCGNPAPIFGPPLPPPAPGPVREPYNPGPGIDIDIDVTIGPTGGITFNIGTGPIVIDPFGDGGDGGGGGGDPGIDQPGTAPSSGLPPGDIGSPAPPADTGPSGVAAGCAPPNSVLVGIKIAILEPLPEVSEYDPLVRRGVCYAYMGTPGNLALNPEGVALRSGQMLFAPLDNLTCYEVRANVGYQLRVTPYYRALEPQEV